MNEKNQVSDNQEVSSVDQSSTRYLLHKIAQYGVRSYIRSSGGTGMLLKLVFEKKSDEIRKLVRDGILLERFSFGKDSEEANLHESEIDNYLEDNSLLLRLVLDETLSQRLQVDKAWSVLSSRYSTDAILPYKKSIISKLYELNYSDLIKVVKSKEFGHKVVVIGTIDPEPNFKELDELLDELKIQSVELTEMPSLKYALSNYIDTGSFGAFDIEELIRSGTNLTIDQKYKILLYFIPTIPYGNLVSLGITDFDKEKYINDSLLRIISEGHNISIEEIKALLESDDIKGDIQAWMKNVDELEIPTTELNAGNVEFVFDNNISQLAEIISDKISEIGSSEVVRNISSLYEFKLKIKNELKNESGICAIENIDDLGLYSYLVTDSGTTEEKAWRVLATDTSSGHNNTSIYGFTLEGFHTNGGRLGMAAFTEYDVLFNAFRDKIKAGGKISITKSRPSYIDTTDSEIPFDDYIGFTNWLNMIDPANKSKKFENGMSFSVRMDDEEEVYRIEDLDPLSNTFTLRDQYNHVYSNMRMTLEGFYRKLKKSRNYFEFKRLTDVSTLEKFAQHTSINGILFEDNQLVIDSHDSHHGHGDHHGSDDAPSNKAVWGFKNEDGNVIQTQFDGNLVTIIELQPYQESYDNDEGKRKTENKMKELEWPKMTLEGLRYFLEKHKFNIAVSENPFKKKREEIHDDVHPHFHSRSFLGKLMGMKSISDFSKAFSMGTHMISHMLEEQSKMHAAEAMYGFFNKTLGKDHALTMHALMEFSGDIGKAIDEKVSYLKRLAGLPRRKEIHHILLTRPAKPHEILAALIVTAEMAGHLYPDSKLQDLQGGQYVWFESVCLALGYDPKTELNKAQEKEENKNTETSEHIHETILLTRFFKLHQDDNPYIQAIAGGSKFWNAVSSGRNGQVDKGKKEVGEFLGAMDRAEYVVSKMESNEPEIVAGSYPGIYGKDPSAKNLGPAFVWALSNFPNTAHPEVSNTFKNMMDGNGVAFHALPFCRNKQNSNIYKSTLDVLMKNLVHKNPGVYQSMYDAWEKTKHYAPGGEYTFKEDHIRELWLFWKNYHKIIHPILQLTDPYISSLIQDEHTDPRDRSVLNSYVDKLGTTVSEGRLNDTGPDDNIMKMGGYRFNGGSMIVDIDPDDKQKSVNRLLNYIHIGQNGDIGNVHHREQIWNGQIVKFIESIRENENFITNPLMQEQQFIKIHDQIMTFLRQKIVERYFSGAEKQEYIRQLASLGFDMSKSNIHQQEIPGRPIDFGGKEAFQRFINRKSSTEIIQTQSHDIVAELLGNAVNSSNYRQSA